ncbi:hypothetical protein [Micromonospora globosa]|uniref:hypothetical protein n=1 Tax=Micromonospora globosa TaxID=47863 RepID=UPI0004C0A608|nr:hypothetical protein [Micromonospora globosa]
MTPTAVYARAAVLVGGPAVMLAPFALARRSAEEHADRAAAAVRQTLARREAAARQEITR